MDANSPYVVQPEEVYIWSDLKNYFRQRLGAEFMEIPALRLARFVYAELNAAPAGPFYRMKQEDPVAARELFVVFEQDRAASVILTFNIEKPDVGSAVCAFLRQNGSTQTHVDLARSLQNLAQACQELHHRWQARPVRYDVPNLATLSNPPH
ncbi:MAG: hypothetical protein PW734_01065 [Verrucomicrobium sp.]|nr:hypothetical protein [Verrucomicrobium sp.]